MIEIFHDDCNNLHNEIPLYDFLMTDPPYGISRKNGFKTMKNNAGGTFGMDFGEWDKNINVTEWIKPAIQNLKDGGNIIIFHDWKKLSYISEKLTECGCDVKRCLIWNKTNPTPFNRDRVFVNTNEFMIWATKGKKWTFNRHKDNFETGVFSYPSNSKNRHPTQKPVELAKEIIRVLSNKDDLIYDPFAGSGSFAVAAMETDRNYIGVEKEKEYVNLIHERLGKNTTLFK